MLPAPLSIRDLTVAAPLKRVVYGVVRLPARDAIRDLTVAAPLKLDGTARKHPAHQPLSAT